MLQLSLPELCYVGDTMSDYLSLDAGVSFIGCKYGFDRQLNSSLSFPLIDDIKFLLSFTSAMTLIFLILFHITTRVM